MAKLPLQHIIIVVALLNIVNSGVKNQSMELQSQYIYLVVELLCCQVLNWKFPHTSPALSEKKITANEFQMKVGLLITFVVFLALTVDVGNAAWWEKVPYDVNATKSVGKFISNGR